MTLRHGKTLRWPLFARSYLTGPCPTSREIYDTLKKTSQAFQGQGDHRKPTLGATSTSLLSSLRVDSQVQYFKKEDTFSYNVQLSDFHDLPRLSRNLSRKMTLRHRKTLRQPLLAGSYLTGPCPTSREICDTPKKTSHVQLQRATLGFQRSSPVKLESQSKNDSPSRKNTLAASVRGSYLTGPSSNFREICDTSKKTSLAFHGHEDRRKPTLGVMPTSLLSSQRVDLQVRNFKKEDTFSYNVQLWISKIFPGPTGISKEDTFSYNVQLSDFKGLPWSSWNLNRKMTLRHGKTLWQPLHAWSYLTGPCSTSRKICDTPKKTSQAFQGHEDHRQQRLRATSIVRRKIDESPCSTFREICDTPKKTLQAFQGHEDHRKPRLRATSIVCGKIDEKIRHVQLQHATLGFPRSSLVEPKSQSENDSLSQKNTPAAFVRGVISHRPMLDFSRVCDALKKTSQAFQGHEDHRKPTLGATSTSILSSLRVDLQVRNFKKEDTFSYNVQFSDFQDLPRSSRNLSRKMTLRHGKTHRQCLFAGSYLTGPCPTSHEICDTPKKTSQAFQGHGDH
uniref:Uncharacterized protein n=1 Tax=Fagus sylvatica TaxID=28930 RepID=A0A2N9I3D0_FAGSY